MIYSLSTKEEAAIFEISEESGLTPAQVMRLAIAQYQLWHKRLAAGETPTWSGDAERARESREKVTTS